MVWQIASFAGATLKSFHVIPCKCALMAAAIIPLRANMRSGDMPSNAAINGHSRQTLRPMLAAQHVGKLLRTLGGHNFKRRCAFRRFNDGINLGFDLAANFGFTKLVVFAN